MLSKGWGGSVRIEGSGHRPPCRSQVGTLHKSLVRAEAALSPQCREASGLSADSLARAEPLDKVLQQVSAGLRAAAQASVGGEARRGAAGRVPGVGNFHQSPLMRVFLPRRRRPFSVLSRGPPGRAEGLWGLWVETLRRPMETARPGLPQ